MATYQITAPDGNKYNVSGDGTQEEALAEFQKTWKPADGMSLSPVDHSAIYKSAADLGKQAIESVGNATAGIVSGTGKLAARYGMALPNAIRDISQRQMPGTTSDQMAGVADQYGKLVGADTSSTSYSLGHAAPEMLATASATGLAGGALAPQLARLGIGRFAPAAADVAVNAGYEGAKAGSEGQGITDVMKAAGMGAGGALLGHGIGGIAQRGVTPYSSKAAQDLAAGGVNPTIGQHLGPAASAAEEGGTFVPVIGGALSRARNQTLQQYSRAETNAAIAPIGAEVKGTGRKAVEAADDMIDAHYEKWVDQTFMPSKTAQDIIKDTTDALEHMPLLSDQQLNTVKKYIETKVQPELAYAQRTGNIVPGRTMKEFDKELGSYARQYSKSTTSSERELGYAFRDLQQNLRAQLQGNSPEAVAELRNADKAFRNLMPVEKAMHQSIGQGGHFTPEQLYKAGRSTKVDVGDTDLNRAGLDVLPGGQTKTESILKKAVQLAGTSGAHYASPYASLPAWLGINALYSRPVRSLMARGVPGVDRAASKLPFTAAQLGARIGANEEN